MDGKFILKVTFKYRDSTISIGVEPYKRISILKDKVIELFFPISKSFQLIWINRDLTPFYEMILGDFFKNRSNIIVRVNETEDIINISDLKQTNNRNKSTSKVLPDINAVNHFNTQPLSLPSPSPSPSSVKNSKIETTCSPNSNSLIIDLNVLKDKEKCVLCNLYKINFFCRTCDIFLCKSCCRNSNSEHNTHKHIKLNLNNLDGSVKNYQSLLLSDLDINSKANNFFIKEFKSESNTNPSVRKEIILKKIDKIEEMFNDVKKQLQMEQLIINSNESIENKIKIILKDVKDFEINYNNTNNLEEFKDYFSNLNKKDVECENLNKNISSFILHSDINLQINKIYKNVEDTIDHLLHTGVKLEDSFTKKLNPIDYFKIRQKFNLNKKTDFSKNTNIKRETSLKIKTQKQTIKINKGVSNSISNFDNIKLGGGNNFKIIYTAKHELLPVLIANKDKNKVKIKKNI